MRHCDQAVLDQGLVYQKRRDVVVKGLRKIGWEVESPRGSMFVWAKISPRHLVDEGTIDFCLRLMDEAEVAVAPGRAFGENGEDHMRIALVENEQRLRQAIRNISRFVQQKPIRKTKPNSKNQG